MFEKVLIANRGEIAVRVMRTLREFGIKSVAVFSEADRQALHVRMADEAYCVGPAPSAESYLRVEKILEVARKSGAQAIHPGYGFLSENADFARACQQADVVFVGPSPHAIEAMGSKTGARTLMDRAGVPLVPGTKEPLENPEQALELARQYGFPVLIKASAGGGGKGMRRVDDPQGFKAAFEGARREALSAFGSGEVYLEKYVLQPKHVEIQVLADTHGNTVHLFERDCSVQRRHQKIIEEAPCPVLLEETRRKMGEVAVRAAQAVDYVGAGTVEFLLDADQNFYFLEMNTRLQVEHPITELITGLDLVAWQLRVADGQALPFGQEDLEIRGHAIECRIYAEDPYDNFRPSPGHVPYLAEPQGPGVRVDSGVYSGATVPVHYDPMIAKLSVWAADREQAIERMRRALSEYVVAGIHTNISAYDVLLTHPDFVDGRYDTDLIPELVRQGQLVRPARAHGTEAEMAAVLAAYLRDETISSQSGGASRPSAHEGGDVPDRNAWKRYGRFRQLGR